MSEIKEKPEKREIKKTYAIRFHPSVVKRLDKRAKKVHRDRSNMIEHIINQYLDSEIEDWEALKRDLLKNGRI